MYCDRCQLEVPEGSTCEGPRLDRYNAESLALTEAFEEAQAKAMASPTPDMWDGIERGIGRTPPEPPALPAPRSCPTCGPCPGGPGSTPLNETDKSCWRCGRTDLS